jgi:hypothetical protein
MNNGWIKLHRKILDNPINSKPSWFSVWVHLLLLANHEDGHKFIWNGQNIQLNKGQFVTGRKKLKAITGVPESTIERVLNYLETEHQIEQQKTQKYRLITILKWNDYQILDIKPDNKWTTDGQQTDTFKKYKNDKKEKNDTASESFNKFWEGYPRKEGRKKCEDLWQRKKLEPYLSVILEFIEKASATDRWKKGFVPHATTFLNGERWTDDLSTYRDMVIAQAPVEIKKY